MSITEIAKQHFQKDQQTYGGLDKLSWDRLPKIVKDLYKEDALSSLEKCVVLLQVLTYVGEDLYDEYVDEYPGNCSRSQSEQFLKDNSSFIDY